MQYHKDFNEKIVIKQGMSDPPQHLLSKNLSTFYPTEEKTLMAEAFHDQAVYPEVFYKVQPFIVMACDQMEAMGGMPTQSMIDQMTDRIYEDVCQMYPEMAEYAQSTALQENDQLLSVQYGRRYNRRSQSRFRRRGLFRDLIDILFLYELLGRRGTLY